MTKTELIEWSHAQVRVMAEVHRLDPPLLGGIEYNVMLWHWVGYTVQSFVYAGFGHMCRCDAEALEFARACTDDVRICYEEA